MNFRLPCTSLVGAWSTFSSDFGSKTTLHLFSSDRNLTEGQFFQYTSYLCMNNAINLIWFESTKVFFTEWCSVPKRCPDRNFFQTHAKIGHQKWRIAMINLPLWTESCLVSGECLGVENLNTDTSWRCYSHSLAIAPSLKPEMSSIQYIWPL